MHAGIIAGWTLAYVGTWTYLVIGWFGRRVHSYYEALELPAYSPPRLLYAIITTLLFAAQAAAVILVEEHHGWNLGLTAQVVSLATSVIAQTLFFHLQTFGLIAMFFTTIAAAFQILACDQFFRVELIPGWLLLPSAVWKTYVVVFFTVVWLKNRQLGTDSKLAVGGEFDRDD